MIKSPENCRKRKGSFFVHIANKMSTCFSHRERPVVMQCSELNPIFKKKDNIAKENY